MTKDHIIDIARGLKDQCDNNSISALQTINKTLVDDLTVQSAARQDILQTVSGTTLLDLCKEQFRALYISSGTYKTQELPCHCGPGPHMFKVYSP